MVLVSHAQVHDGQHHENEGLQRYDQQVENRPAEVQQLPAQESHAANQQHFRQQQPECSPGAEFTLQVQPQRDEYTAAVATTQNQAGMCSPNSELRPLATKPVPAVKIIAIRMKISSPAYRLPNSRRPSDTGLATSETSSSKRLGMKNTILPATLFEANGCPVSSLMKPPMPLILMLKVDDQDEHRDGHAHGGVHVRGRHHLLVVDSCGCGQPRQPVNRDQIHEIHEENPNETGSAPVAQ